MIKKKKQFITEKQRFEVLLEDIQSGVHLISEQSTIHTAKLESIDGRLDKMDGRIDKIEVKLVQIDSRLDKIESDIETIKLDIEFIKNDLKQKVNRDEFAALERRLSLLENRTRFGVQAPA